MVPDDVFGTHRSSANSCKQLRWHKRTRRPFDIGSVLELARWTDLECEKCPITRDQRSG
jgi:hypothetical protein